MADGVISADPGLVVLGLLGSAVAVSLLRRLQRRRRDARLAQHWERAAEQSQRCGFDIAFVYDVYQYARRGSKAQIVWLVTGRVQDTWFEEWHAPPGVYVVLGGNTGWGPHNANPYVFYVEREGVIDVVPGDAPHAFVRHRAHLAKRGRKSATSNSDPQNG